MIVSIVSHCLLLRFVSQIDIFELVGAPLVENCLAGFNTSIFAYGGKYYTIWGPTNTLLEENAYGNEQGLTSRVFARLFSRINEEQNTHADKQLHISADVRFSRNLHLQEDNKTGVYVENLNERSRNECSRRVLLDRV
ncbi:putative plus-end-directed kinesin ATPase [Helianthus annuus]|uniref:Plus-end-directed kinesin ATPase n=1 Tax=Helianthus annuus TaxID=4232 RepID=A0A9K3N385_HELAN|nr:putative plus-end-directed kinesin ATPase [Helianthus annuus]